MSKITTAALSLLAASVFHLPLNAQVAEKPNVLFIAVDDLNDWIGCLGGHPQAKTPNIDALAARGVLFTNAHCAAPACNPSRAAVFSGLMPYHTQVWSNDSPQLLRQHPDIVALPRAFKAAGYTTLGTGKLLHSSSNNKQLFDQHFSPEQRWSPFSSDEVRYAADELPSKGTDNPRHVIARDGQQDIVLPLNRMPSDRNPDEDGGESFDWGPIDVPDSAMGDTQITDWAIERLQAGFDQPFFMGVGFYRPHIPLFAPSKYFAPLSQAVIQLPAYTRDDLDDLSDVGRRWALEAVTAGSHATVVKHQQWEAAILAYLACTHYVDHEIGRLLQALDAKGLSDNTIIVLWTDHGWHLGEKQHWGKWTGWERSTRVPLIIAPTKPQSAAFAAAGSRCDQPVSLIDLYPTLAELCEVATPELDGRSLVPQLQQPAQATGRAVLTIFDQGNVALRSEQWRYIRYADGSEELYDHRTDPNEWHNLAAETKQAALIEQFRGQVPAAAIP